MNMQRKTAKRYREAADDMVLVLNLIDYRLRGLFSKRCVYGTPATGSSIRSYTRQFRSGPIIGVFLRPIDLALVNLKPCVKGKSAGYVWGAFKVPILDNLHALKAKGGRASNSDKVRNFPTGEGGQGQLFGCLVLYFTRRQRFEHAPTFDHGNRIFFRSGAFQRLIDAVQRIAYTHSKPTRRIINLMLMPLLPRTLMHQGNQPSRHYCGNRTDRLNPSRSYLASMNGQHEYIDCGENPHHSGYGNRCVFLKCPPSITAIHLFLPISQHMTLPAYRHHVQWSAI